MLIAPQQYSAEKKMDFTGVMKTVLRSGNLAIIPAPMMITSSCVEASVLRSGKLVTDLAPIMITSTCVEKTVLRSGSPAMETAPMMITSTCVETSAQSLPAPAATLCLDLTPAVPASSPSSTGVWRMSPVLTMEMKKDCYAAPRWTVLVVSSGESMASAMTTAPPPSPVLTSAHKIMDSTFAEKTALRSGHLAMDPALMMITSTCVGTSV